MWSSKATLSYGEEASAYFTGPHCRYALSLALDTYKRNGHVVGSSSKPLQILDSGGGTGALTITAARALQDTAHIEYTDYSEAMVDIMQHKVKLLSMEDRVQIQRADSQSLSHLPDNHFDLIFCCFVLMFIPDKRAAMKEIVRLLKPGGILVITTWAETSRSQFHALWSSMLKQGTAAVNKGAAAPPSSQTGTFQTFFAGSPLNSEKQLEQLVQETEGLSLVSCLPHSELSREYISVSDLWFSVRDVFPAGALNAMGVDDKWTPEQKAACAQAIIAAGQQVLGENATFSLHHTSLVTVAQKV